MASRSICRIDMTTGRVVESFELPNEDINWIGMEFLGEHLYLLGNGDITSFESDGIIYRLNRP